MKKDQAFFESSDILADEIELLEEKIEAFNTQTVITSDHITSVLDDEEIEFVDSNESFSAVADYTEAVDDNFHHEIDSVLVVSIQ